MTDDDLDKLERTLAAMTPGPWRVGNVEKWHVFVRDDEAMAPELGRVLLRMNQYFPYESDAEGIVAIVNAAPALIAEVRRLRSDVAAARAAVQNLSSITGHRRVEGTL